MPRDYPKPSSRSGPKPSSGPRKPGGFAKKPWERSARPEGGDRPYRKPSEGGDRPYRKPFGERREYDRPPRREFDGPKREFSEKKDFRAPRYDDEQFTASGKVADIVGTEPQSKFELLKKLWDFFRDEDIIVATKARRTRPDAADWRGESDNEERPRERSYSDDRPAKKSYRKPAGDHPTARKVRSLEGVVRKKLGERRER